MVLTEPWFSAEAARYFSGAAVLTLAALAVPFIIRGQYRRTVLTIWGLIIAVGLALSAAGVIALLSRQPFHVTAPLLITGLVMAASFSFSLVFIRRIYRQAEKRKVAAQEL